MTSEFLCPLCSRKAFPYWQDKRRSYLGCNHCGMVHVPQQYWLSSQEEKAIYDLHQNQVDDPGYRRFLSRLFEPMQALLTDHAEGLEFGCGPGPALAAMFAEAGHRVSLFDINYYPDNAALDKRYDFVTATEVVEHLARPREELERLWSLLKPGGLLGIMTKRVLDKESFSRWHYKNDLTHICFFAEASFKYLCTHWQARQVFSGNDVVILQKPATDCG